MMTEEQSDKVRAAYRELDLLRRAGTVTKADFERIMQDAVAAAGSYTPALEGLLMQGLQLGYLAR